VDDDRPDCCFDDWARANAKRARSKETVARITSRLLAALRDAGLEGRSVLDVGCGTGDLALAAVARGAARATGFDLGAGAIESARTLARDRGLADRVTFEIGNGSVDPLPDADVVVLNRVLCCFPDAQRLLGNTLAAAGVVFAFTAPVDRGFAGAWNTILGGLANTWYRLRDARYGGFRVYAHDLESAEATILRASFRRVHRERCRVVWDLRVYVRSASPEAFASS